MAFQPVNATALAELIFDLDGEVTENTLYFRRANAYTVADLTDLATKLRTWWTTLMQSHIAEACALTAIKCTSLADQTGPQFTLTAGLPAVGAVPSNAVPNNSAFVVTFRTALIGRSFRGRNYIAGIPETQVDVSRLATTEATYFRDAYAGIPGIVTAAHTWVVVSRTVNQVVQMPSALTNPVTTVDVIDNVMDSQRRRLPGRGK